VQLKDIFLDIIIGTTLFKIARSRADAKQVITAQSPQIFEHFVKLFVFNLPDARDHWIIELNAFFNIINRIYLKPNNKKPDKNTVYTWMLFDSSPHYDINWVNGYVQNALQGEYKGVQLYDYDAANVLNKILSIIDRILIDIAQPNKFISVEYYL